MEFDHIGIAVESIEKYFNEILKPVLGINTLTPIIEDPIQHSKIAFAISSNGVRMELIEPLDDNSPVHQILKKKRGGLYHLCFRATNFMNDIENCKSNKFIMLGNPQPAIAFNNRKVVFFMTPTFDMIELIEEEKIN